MHQLIPYSGERNKRLDPIVANSEPVDHNESRVSLLFFSNGNNTPVPIREKDWQYHD